jgi:hypothetical protein
MLAQASDKTTAQVSAQEGRPGDTIVPADAPAVNPYRLAVTCSLGDASFSGPVFAFTMLPVDAPEPSSALTATTSAVPAPPVPPTNGAESEQGRNIAPFVVLGGSLLLIATVALLFTRWRIHRLTKPSR